MLHLHTINLNKCFKGHEIKHENIYIIVSMEKINNEQTELLNEMFSYDPIYANHFKMFLDLKETKSKEILMGYKLMALMFNSAMLLALHTGDSSGLHTGCLHMHFFSAHSFECFSCS